MPEEFLSDLILVVVGAIIAGAATIISCVIAYKSERKKEEAERRARQAELDVKNTREKEELRQSIAALETAVKSSDELRDAKLEARLEKMEARLDGMDKKLDEHNHYADRFAEIAKDTTEIKVALSRLEARTE